MMKRFLKRLRALLRRSEVEVELDDELAYHLERQIELNVADGMNPEEARFAALRSFDGIELAREECRDARRVRAVEDLVQDLRHGLRRLVTERGLTAVVVITLAIGIGANTAVFTVVNGVLFSPLPFREPDRIITMTSVWPASGNRTPTVSIPDFMDWQAGSALLESTAYYRNGRRAVVVESAGSYAQVTRTSPGFFDVLGIAPTVGRGFTPDEDPGAGTVVISHDFWRTRFAERSDVLGKTLLINDHTMTIIGVMPPGFGYPDASDLWQLNDAVRKEYEEPRGTVAWFALARLKDGVTAAQLQAELTSVADRLERQFPDTNAGRRVEVSGLLGHMTGDTRPTLLVVLGAVGVVLVIACANVAMLLLAKGGTRTREVAVRAALGASRARIVGQFLTENLLLALLAGGLGALIGGAATPALLALAPHDLPRIAEVGMDGRVYLFTLAVSVVTTLLFGLAPALTASRVDLNETLKAVASRTGVSDGTRRLSRLLVVGEVALAVVLVTAAGLLIRSFVALNTVELGFEPARVLVLDISVPGETSGAATFYRELVAELRNTPGVLAAGATLGTPGTPSTSGSYWIEHRPDQATIDPFAAVYSVSTPGTLAALGIPIERGRDFTDGDSADGPRTAIINEALARKEFGTQDPIGRTIISGFDMEGPMTIVGVVGDVRQYGPARAPIPEVILPYEQHHEATGGALRVVIKTNGPPEGLEKVVGAMVTDREPTAPMRFTTMEQTLAEEYAAAPRFRMVVVSGFGLMALSLAMAGVYGVLTYSVGQRRREIGLRMALGATKWAVSWMVIRDGAVLVGSGMLAGVLGSLAVARLIGTMLFQVEPFDPFAYATGLLVLSVIALVACYVPAVRAARIDPLRALGE